MTEENGQRVFKPVVDINIPRCKFCGDVLLDQEIFCYGQCLFCFDGDVDAVSKLSWSKKIFIKLFKGDDHKIFYLKKKIRDTVYDLPEVKQLKAELKVLCESYYPEIFPQKYSEEKSIYRIQYESILEQIEDYKRVPRNAFNNCLGKFGSLKNDDVPTVRNIVGRNKKSLIKALEKEYTFVRFCYKVVIKAEDYKCL